MNYRRPWHVEDGFVGEDCDPPEPGKHWITIADSDGKEIAVIINRKGECTPEQHKQAQLIVDCVNCIWEED